MALVPTDDTCTEPSEAADTTPDADNSTEDTQFLGRPAGFELPVFLDASGRRQKRIRALLWVVCLTGLTYAAVLVLSMLSSHEAAVLVPDARRHPSAPATAAPMISAEAALERSPAAERPAGPPAAPRSAAALSAPSAPSDSSPAAPRAATRSPNPRTDTAPTTAAPSAPATPTAAAPSTSAKPGPVRSLLDTLFD
ncbi:hypothetical protein [Cryptosporangium phraense]|uniref:hypothetical protein n=1 Tax=Cryptosporangium phraense TaxID=2593070 RepID=UPI0014795E20|nr:hypothetical protein [Cryptosporangium phraense]